MSARDVVIVDAGGTNFGSLRSAFTRLGAEAVPTTDVARIRAASHVILPGVGAAGPGMAALGEAGLVDVLRDLRQPVLGICLGMQLLFDRSEEGDTSCLGVIGGAVRRIEATATCRVPHIGWNRLQRERDDGLLEGLPEPAYAYFVHSYAVPAGPHTLASVEHGTRFAAIVRERNFVGMQFHPERSAALGARLLAGFLA